MRWLFKRLSRFDVYTIAVIMPFLLYGYFIIAGCLAIVAVLIEIWVEKYSYLDLDTK